MDELIKKQCEVCKAGPPLLTSEEINKFKLQIPDWEIVNIKGVNQLKCTFKFSNFTEALSFTNKIGEISEKQGHHPSILTEWGKVTVTWWTHKINGLHMNDFIMASKTDNLYRG